jgi:ABC-type Zn2+ transport system substrate-binding protein/surface adhesin
MHSIKILVLAGACLTLSGCVGTIIDATTDAAVAVVKIPFRIGHAAVDAAMGHDEDDHEHGHDHQHDDEAARYPADGDG